MLIPGKYAVCDNKMVLTIDAQGERYAIKMHMKNDQKAFFHMRLPAWASSSEILVNGAPTAEYRLVDGCIGIERVWHDGDEIVAVLEQPVMRAQQRLSSGNVPHAWPAGVGALGGRRLGICAVRQWQSDRKRRDRPHLRRLRGRKETMPRWMCRCCLR